MQFTNFCEDLMDSYNTSSTRINQVCHFFYSPPFSTISDTLKRPGDLERSY